MVIARYTKAANDKRSASDALASFVKVRIGLMEMSVFKYIFLNLKKIVVFIICLFDKNCFWVFFMKFWIGCFCTFEIGPFEIGICDIGI
jgi:hypothetical protein